MDQNNSDNSQQNNAVITIDQGNYEQQEPVRIQGKKTGSLFTGDKNQMQD